MLGNSSIQIDQGQTGCGVRFAPEMFRGLLDDDFQSRADICLDEMTAKRGTVRPSHNDVSMDSWLVFIRGNVSDQGKDLDLFLERNTFVIALFEVEMAQGYLA